MSTGKLKAQYNRVRTSTALHTTSIWSNTIGLQQEQAGTNAAIEASIYAPGGGRGGRAAKQQRAQELIEATGYQPSVRDFEGLKALARRSGGDAATNRGACKICGGLGHLTKQCRNFLSSGGAGGPGGPAGAAGDAGRQLLTADDDDAAALLESDGPDSSRLGSDSDSGRSSDSGRKRKRKSSSSRADRERSSSKHSKKSKKHKKDKSSKKHKRERRSRSRSRDRSGRRDRERSRSRSPARRD